MNNINITTDQDGMMTGFPYHDALIKELCFFGGSASIKLVKDDITYVLTLDGLVAFACSEFLPGALCGWIWIVPPESKIAHQNQAFSSHLAKQGGWPDDVVAFCLDGAFGISFAAYCQSVTARICE